MTGLPTGAVTRRSRSPTVSRMRRKLPATAEWGDCVDVVETAEEFTRAVLERLNTGVPESQKLARKRLESEGWSAKAEQFEKWVDGL